MIPLHSAELLPETPYIWRARNPGHRHRLICFPHAGAGAAAYADWAGLLPPEIELVAVQLPGRQNRIAEEPFRSADSLVAALVHALRPALDGDFAFYGHSSGAAIAYELAVALRSRGRPGPQHLFLSGRAAPQVAEIRLLHTLPDAEFRAEMLALGGIDPEIAADENVMTALIPLLRNDFGVWERHSPTLGAQLDCPITVLSGQSDPRAPLASLDGWRAHTNAEFTVQSYPGGHFYFLDATAEVVSFIGRKMLCQL
jgi:medium-chain acyl-[acyl-carrier-protein] hydrolase